MDQADKILRQIENQAQDAFLPIIGSEKGKVLIHTVKRVKPNRILEVGTLVGYSAILMAKHLPKGGRIITLEIDSQLAKIAQDNIFQAGFEDKVEIIIGDAKKTLKEIKERVDILFLDAVKEEYLTYLKLAEPKLNPRAAVIADNVKIFADSMTDYLEYVRESGLFRSQTFDFGQDAVEVSVKI